MATALSACSATALGHSADDFDSFLDMNLEDLLTVEVTSVSKKKQKLTETAAAVFVITNEDIRRSGVTSIPEALRLAPGLQVARLDNNTWAISARGFNAEFANKLLVLIDGRSVYTPMFAGVYWEDQDTILEDIDRIEVIRGPGATVWGANAVNGVINIITKSASETTGALAQLTAGDEEKAIAQLRYGADVGEDIAARAYIKFADRDESHAPDLDDGANDDWQSRRAGFRIDGDNDSTKWTVQGDVYDNDIDQTIDEIWFGPDEPGNTSTIPGLPFPGNQVEDTVKTRGQNLVGKLAYQLNSDSLVTLQLYYDHTERSEGFAGQDVKTYDFDFNHLFSGFQNHEFIWGIGYRRINDEFDSTFATSAIPAEQTSELFSGFIQDEVALQDNLWLTLGTKIEHNTYTDFEVQPSIKLLWAPDPGMSLWTSLARAVRTPSTAERRTVYNTGVLVGQFPIIFTNFGSDNYDSENLLAFEVGFRYQPTEAVSFDLALFNNDYRNLSTIESLEVLTIPDPFNPNGPPLEIPLTSEFDNNMEVTSQGGELLIDWRVEANWRLQASYSYIHTEITSNKNNGRTLTPLEESTPNHYLTLRSFYDFSNNISADLWIYYVDKLESTTIIAERSEEISAFTSVNLRLAWQPAENLELSLVGQNLTDDRHKEFVGQYFILPTEVERSVYGQIKFEF